MTINPISSNQPTGISQISNQGQVGKMDLRPLNYLPNSSVALQQLAVKPAAFTDNFKELMKPIAMNPNEGQQKGAQLTAPLVFLSKTGINIIDAYQQVLKDG